MKSIKKEFLKLFPEGLEFAYNFKIINMYGVNLNEIFININSKHKHYKIKNYDENDYKKLEIILIKYNGKYKGDYSYNESAKLILNDNQRLIIHNALEMILFNVGDNWQ